jgi:hypothetical protein
MIIMLQRYVLLLAVILLWSCSPEEPLVNSFVDEWRLVSTSGSTDLQSTPVPAGVATSANPNNVDFGTSPSMVRFRNNIYIFSNNRPWIVVYDAEKLIYSDTIFTFGELDGITDLCFANATTAYAVSPVNKCIGVVDLTASAVASTIPTPGAARQIACLGNQLAATIPDSNAVIILDTRTNTIVDKIEITQSPWYIRDDAAANVFCVVSLGNGKVNREAPTTPTISFISPATRDVLKTLDLTINVTDGPKQFPRGLAISSSQQAYVPVQSGLLRVSTRTRSRVSSAIADSFDIVSYNDARAEIICQRAAGGQTPDVVVFNEDASERKFTIPQNRRAAAMLGVPK